MAPVVGYWDVRALAQFIRNLLVYKGVEFQDKQYKFGPAPDFDRSDWLKEKFTLGLKFPNLPYYIDGNVKITQSLAILRYLGRKHDLAGRNEEETLELDVLEQQARDLSTRLLTSTAPTPNYEEVLKAYGDNIDNVLKPWEEHLASHKWALGDRLTYVDFLLYEGLDWHREFKGEAVQRHPHIVEYLKKFEELPNLKEYFASDKYHKYPIVGPHRKWGYKK
ncbi:glutathione S-transferase [Dermacentor silvarum]|uniref:glutathione S-transferase n=1 Tax=Dermacentor silvarum TaxID=543639 RepID=UPI00189BBEB2|nr:glutathione S-transferase [Dermacentor silvarum]XP_049519832.1 glutathione S-transferase [Dermacentor silvarum]